jgi:ATP-dependent Clp protease ATP-binding subunit ClpA
MFERFTERARQVIVLAQEEARILKHNYIGTEHILLGLLREEESLAAFVLGALDITVEHTRAQVVRIVGSGEEVTSGQIPFTPRAKKVLELALREALALGHDYIGTEHLLLGLARENGGVAARILLDVDADSEKIRNEVIRILSGPEGHQWAPGRAVPSLKRGLPGTMIDEANQLVEAVASEIEQQLGRAADAGDLLVTLACVDGLAARALALLDIDADSLNRAAQAARSEGARPSFLPPPELVAELKRVREEKESKIRAQEFQEAAELRDAERRLTNEARWHEWRHEQATLAAVRSRLGLAAEG